MTNYEQHKKWRKKYPHKRNKERKTYYNQTSYAEHGGNALTIAEIDEILKHEVPDMELAKKLGRSVQSIQIARCRYKKRSEE